MINNYLSKVCVKTDSHTLFVQPYTEARYNLKMVFEPGSNVTLKERVKHFVAGLSLYIPIINTIVFLALRILVDPKPTVHPSFHSNKGLYLDLLLPEIKIELTKFFQGGEEIPLRDISIFSGLQVLTYPIDSIILSQAIYNAARKGHLNLLKWLLNKSENPTPLTESFQHLCGMSDFAIQKGINIEAAKGGSLEVIRWLEKNGQLWQTVICSSAAEGGQLEVLKWAFQNRCPWDEETCAKAAEKGHLEVLKWLREKNCPWDIANTCQRAASGGHLKILKWIKEKDHACNTFHNCSVAIEKGHLEVLKWAFENGYPLDYKICSRAAAIGNLEILKWAHANKYPLAEEICFLAVKGGHFEVLKWLREIGCPWDKSICNEAARKGFFEILKWAYENGCPLDKNTCFPGDHVRGKKLELFENFLNSIP